MARPRRLRAEDDPELDIDYVTSPIGNLEGAQPQARICAFTLRAARLHSHYLLMLPPKTDKLAGDELRRYVFKHISHAIHTRTCEHVAR